MGQINSIPCVAPREGHLGPIKDGLVEVEKMTRQKGGIAISGRYSTQKSLHSDFTLETSWGKPKVIGSGMNGPVHVATGKDGRRYAVKSFKKARLNLKGLQARQALRNEVETYLALDHPHIARLEQVYETQDDIHLVMEFMAGGELFDRLSKKRVYTEEAAAGALYQMLLAVAYLHAHDICHRDLKLENFLYESEHSDLLKLIDFGFAHICAGNTRLSKACGSLHYVAPEVLRESYSLSADMWSLGVISHMLLTGSPLFHGSDNAIRANIRNGKTELSPRFGKLSDIAQEFVQSLLVVDPAKRLTAQGALEHPFLANKSSRETTIDVGILDGLRKYADASRFQRACFSMMAWSLSQEDRRALQEKFLEMDVERTGAVSLPQFKSVLQQNYRVNSAEAEQLFATLDTDHDNEICYSEFLAAVLQDRVRMHEGILRKTFARFDCDESGRITVDNLRSVLGDTFEDVDVKELMNEVDASGNGFCYEEFLQYLRRADLESPRPEEHDCTSRSPLRIPAAHSLAGALIDKVKPLEPEEELLPMTPKSQASPARAARVKGLPTPRLMRAAAKSAAEAVVAL